MSEEKLRYFLKQVTANLHETRRRLRELEAADEPIAVVGLGCRYPGGVREPEDLWELVASGTDAVAGFPVDRGWDVENTGYERQGGFVHDVADFDAGFFGISPREAVAMDPQQRLLLEVSWETLEHAGFDPASLKGSRTGVFVGATTSGYDWVAREHGGAEGHLVAGSAMSVLSGRLAYTLGLTGPAVSVDTACSSSLLSVHLAARALRAGECSLALAGGVMVMVTPGMFAEFSRQGGLASDGRCKAFSAAADGTGWGEGAGMVLLERLPDAQRNGHEVLAVIRGSATNQDGASNGLTAPSGPAQRRVIRAALTDAKLSTSDVDAVEAHGTGTELGDPIEAEALLATYGQDRSAPLWLGSLKSNIGHTQTAAGVAGVIKMVLALRHELLPRSLHAAEPTPHVDWSAGNVRLLTEAVPWPASERPRRAGVSAFGASGTNVHLILEEAPAAEEAPEIVEPASALDRPMWPVSGRTPAALAAQAGRLREFVLARPGLSTEDVGFALATTRTAFAHRAVVTGSDRAELLAGLAAVAAGESAAGVVTGAVVPGRVGFVFAGQGSQRAGMGRELYASSPVFAAAFDEACGAIEAELGLAIRDVVLGGAEDERADQTLYAQTGLFAVEVGLVAMLAAWGVKPDAVAGHSVGEIAAAHAAGVLSLADAARLVANRARLMQALPEGGAMAAIAVSEEDIRTDVENAPGVSLAAVNGPASVVISGDAEAVETIVERWREAGRRVRRLRVSHAFHSHRMDPALDDLAAVARSLTFSAPEIPWAGALTGELIDTPDAGYWPAQAREAVRFADAVETLAAEGVTVFLEIGPDGTLSSMGSGVLPGSVFIPLLHPGTEAPAALATALSKAFVHGAAIDWSTVLSGHKIGLPTYAFQRSRFWPDTTVTAGGAGSAVESRFWSAIENGDVAGLAGELAVEDGRLREIVPALASWRRRELDDTAAADWRYRVSWIPVAEPAPAVLTGTWLVVGDDPEITAALTGHGAEVLHLDVDGLDRERLAAALPDVELSGVVSLLAFDECPHPEFPALPGGLAATLTLAQALGDAGVSAPLWVLTRGAVATGPRPGLPSPRQAQAWGLGRVIGLEHPERWGGLADLPSTVDTRTAAQLCAVLAGIGEDQVVLRPSGIAARRLTRAPLPRRRETWTPRGSVLITGGTGAIGGHAGRWLAGRSVPRVVLTSRSGPAAAGAARLAAELAGRGSAVDVVAADIARREQVSALLRRIPDLSAVVHAAGVGQATPVQDTTLAEQAEVTEAKVAGAEHLDELTADRGLDAFVVFSSISATWGSAWQPGYAAGNAFLDALAENRRARGLAATSIAWGLWGGHGLGAGDGGEQARRRGLRAMDPRTAVRALAQALDGDEHTITVADVDWNTFAPTFTLRAPSPLLGSLPEFAAALAAGSEPVSDSADTGLAARLAGMPLAEQDRLLTDLVRSRTASLLGHPSADAVDPGLAFKELGFDSLTSVELRDRLAEATGLRLSATLVFDHPNPAALAGYLRRELAGGTAEAAGPVAVAATDTEPLAIVGMGLRLPGGVGTPEQLWELLVTGTDAVSGFPADRGWDVTDTGYAQVGGFLEDAADFDPGFFGISPREALAMDPQQRLLLEVSWEALERAGIDPASLKGSRTGVFAGAAASGYGAGTTLESGSDSHLRMGTATSILSGRVCYALGLEGPAITVDTACSSSLVALHLAVRALRSGECTLALAGGVTVMSDPDVYAEFARQQGLAADGRCKAFSATADGTGWAEGAGMLAVERLSDARRHGHRVLALVRGSAINADGASNGLTAPNGLSQQRVIRAALTDARLSTSDIDAVEAHGTGTELGDPIEAQALLATYGRDRSEPLWLGSVKSNLGHAQQAAGVAGVMKMVLALRAGVLPATLHAAEPSPLVDWSSGGVRLLQEAEPWTAGARPRRAAVSAFGISGTNAHVIIEEAPAEVETATGVVPGSPMWMVSGRTAAALAAQAARLREFVLARPGLSTEDVGFSLATTRTAFDHRAVVVGSDREELLAGLAAVAAGESAAGVVAGSVVPGRVGFVFAGQGSQRAGMGRELYASSPVFAAAFDEACALVEAELGFPVRDVVLGETADERADQTLYAQTGLFAVEVGLVALLASQGIRPDAVAGHSVGEIAAAHTAGVLSLADAARLVANRARLMQALPEGGAMAAIAATEAEVLADVGDTPGVSLAAVNGPASVVISGDAEAVETLVERWREAGRRVRRLRVSHAFHSHRMDPALDDLAAVARSLTFSAPEIPWAGALTGEILARPDADYWPAQARDAVRFAGAIETLAAQGVSVFLEIGPDGTLSSMGSGVLPGSVFVPMLRKDSPAEDAVRAALARAHVHGVRVDWTTILSGRTVELPAYAFQHTRFWPQPAVKAEGSPAESGFWTAVENGDLDALTETLAVDGERPFREVLPALAAWRGRERDDSVVRDWRYRISWVPVTEPARATLAGTWLLVGASAEVGATLTTHGAEVITLDADGLDRDQLAAALPDAELAGVVSVLALDRAAHAEFPVVPRGVAATLTLIQALGDAGIDAPLWVLTRGAAALDGEAVDAAQAQIWGLGRVAALEHPDRWGGLVDLPSTWDERAAARLCAVLSGIGEDQVALRPPGVLARRLVHAPRPSGTRTRWRPRGRVLITGGTGGLGGHVSRWLAGRSAPGVVLTSRSGPAAPEVAALAAGVAAAGSTVDIFACDIGNRADVAGLVGRIPDLSAVVHAAGLGQGTPVLDTSVAEHASVTEAKVAGAAHLDELTADRELDAFVVFSSISATWGSSLQPAYAAGNAFLDALAADRRARGLAATAVAWGLWDGGGMGTGEAGETLRRHGLRKMAPRHAIRALAQILDDGEHAITVADVDWSRFAEMFALRRPSPLLGGLPEVEAALAAAPGDSPAGDTELARRLAGLPRAEQERRLTDLVRTEAAAVLGHADAAAIEPGRAFKDLGVDSLTSVELRNRLAAATGLSLPATLVFDYPASAVLAAHLREELLGADAAADVTAPSTVDDEPIAIVGMGCRYPGGAGSPEQFWELIVSGTDAVSGFPADRGWDLGEGLDDTASPYVRRGGFVNEATEFDPAFFGISPREALAMDPQQRLMLETAWEALERSGIGPASLRGSRTGVFAGASASGYGETLAGVSGAEGYLLTGNAGSVISGRVAYTLGLEGPAITVDTACSSSLVALHLAAQALRSGECTLALAGGVAVMATPGAYAEFSKQQGLASDGRCKAFSAAADGIGWAEGAGVVVLERLSDAQRDGHEVLAVIRGTATNQDGASNGLAAPNGPSQQRVIRAALANAGLSASDIDAVEAHGTGTQLGDPIEAQALLATYGRDRAEPLWLGSVKSNIGHTQTAAGVAGVIKMVMALRSGTLPPTLHAEEPSSQVDWSAGDIRLLTEAVEWPAGERPRRAGVSAFGISGTNAHVIIEEAPAVEDTLRDEPRTPAVVSGPVVWPVSARGAEGLAGQAGRLREHVLARQDQAPPDIAWSLATTRVAFEHRAVVLGEDREELAAGLAAVATGQPGAGAIVGTAPSSLGRTVFVFPGQGSQWVGMGRELASCSPVFAARLAECASALSSFVDWSLDDVLAGKHGFEAADVVQPALWAVMVSLAEVWRAAGVSPDAVVGHSQGEIAAAAVAGILSLEDAARVVALRSKALRVLAGKGGMMSVAEPADAVRERIALWGDRLSLAAVNGPLSTVVSGEPGSLRELAESCPEVRTKVIPVDYASHSAQVDALREEILSVLDGITPREAEVPMISAMSGEMLSGPEMDPEYWYASLRETVEFERAIRTLGESGHGVFVETSPHPVLTAAITDTLGDPVVVGTLRRDEGGAERLLASFAEAFVRGVTVEWAKVLGGGRRVALPTYAFQRERYWPEPAVPASATAGTGAEGGFWAAVETGDLTGLAGTLAVDPRSLGEVVPALARWRRRERDDSAVTDWRYHVTWTPVTEPGAVTLSGTWLLVGTSAELAAALTERGATVVSVDADADGDRERLAASLPTGIDDLAGIVSQAVDDTPDADFPVVPHGVAATLTLVQALGDARIDAPLWVVTRGAVATGPGEPVHSPQQAQTWGLGRVVGLEHPDRWGGLVDLPSTWDARTAARLCAVLAGLGEDQVALRRAGILARRLVRAPRPRTGTPWVPRGTVLVTGGTGAVGGHVGRWLAGRAATRTVLVSRSGPGADGVTGLAADLAGGGTAVDVVACDTAERAEVAGLLDRIAATGPALSAVVHAAGVGRGGPVADTTVAQLAEVTAAKVAGAAHLDELTAGLDLDAFVLFSSGAATWGSGLQPGYAAGNAFLDALAESRRARGRVATSIAWGLWGGGGLGAGDTGDRLRRFGLRVMEPRLAVRALGQVLDGGEAAVTVADIDWATFAPAFTARRPSPLLEALPEAGQAIADTGAEPEGPGTGLAARLAGQPRAEQDRVLTDLVRGEAAAVLGYASADALEPGRAFRDLGFDSLTAVDLRNRLTAATGLTLPTTLVFDHPTSAVLAAYLRAEILGERDGDTPPVFTDLDRLEATLAGIPGDSELRADITARLRTALSKWLGGGETAPDETVTGRLESADADEVLDFINNELGMS
ncbi:type I polyketide synthase [Amycolatopsis sp. NPDC059021]|uniref:type I polyketide synthase n=1 Tax=Amycolatopsis sp. NPDC059021 TaxID=3346704 RepID=UPI00366F75F8